MTDEIKKQQTIDQQSFGSNIKDPMEFSRGDLSNKTDEHESDNRLQNSSDHDSDDSSADGNQTPYTESSDWDSNSSCSSDYSCFSEDGSLLMDLEIPLTENEKCLIGEFCKEIKDKIEENEREYKRKISNQESIENWTEGALERIKSVVDTYLKKGIRLNSCYGDRYRTVTNFVFQEVVDVTLNEGLSPINRTDHSDFNIEVSSDYSKKIMKKIIDSLLSKGGKVERSLFFSGELGHVTYDSNYVDKLFAECEKIENDLKNVAYESIANKNKQTQKDELEVEIDNGCFYIKYPQDSTVEVAKILSNEKNEGLNLRVGILQIGKSIVRVESYNGKRNYLDVCKQGVTLSFDSEAGKISIHLNPKKNSNEIEVKLDESSEEVFEKLKKSGLSLGENCLLRGKSVLEAIRNGIFEGNSIPKESTNVIEQPNAATNAPQPYLENISLDRCNHRTK